MSKGYICPTNHCISILRSLGLWRPYSFCTYGHLWIAMLTLWTVMETYLYFIRIFFMQRSALKTTHPKPRKVRLCRRLCCSSNCICTNLERFFHENVGCSVWGLAIHAQSRMIAVSSNLKQVTVFSFGAPSSEEPEYHYEK